jgi:hypothetical protein
MRPHLKYGSGFKASTASINLNSAKLTTSPQTILINHIGGGT